MYILNIMFNLYTYILPSNRGGRKKGREGGKNRRIEGGKERGRNGRSEREKEGRSYVNWRGVREGANI